MSSPEPPRSIILSPRARQDFIDILRYTGETWGEPQLAAYRDKIDDALQLLARNSSLGHRRPDLPDTHRAYLVGSHILVYREHATWVAVVRILHQRMSLTRHT
jgi:toxin ParE1/3/4